MKPKITEEQYNLLVTNESEQIAFVYQHNQSTIPDLDYWKTRCLLAENCLEESPCDPDITANQMAAEATYRDFIKSFGIRA
jgi:hypothetical protein